MTNPIQKANVELRSFLLYEPRNTGGLDANSDLLHSLIGSSRLVGSSTNAWRNGEKPSGMCQATGLCSRRDVGQLASCDPSHKVMHMSNSSRKLATPSRPVTKCSSENDGSEVLVVATAHPLEKPSQGGVCHGRRQTTKRLQASLVRVSYSILVQ